MAAVADAVRRVYDAFERADVAGVRAALADDAVVRVAGRGPFAGTHAGLDAVFELVVRAIEASQGTLHVRVSEVVGDGQLAVALVTHQLLLADEWRRVEAIHVVRLQAGRIVSCDVVFVDAYAADELFMSLAAAAH